MPEIKLTYFDIRGLGEPVRLALAIGEIPYEDDRIVRDQWMELKPKMPYGSLPVMTIDGVQVAQSAALLRYVGKMAGLYPTDEMQALKVDEILDTLKDLLTCLIRYRGGDKDRLREERDKFVNEDLPRYLGGILKRLDDGVWCVGGELSIADIMICHLVTDLSSGFWEYVPKELGSEYERAQKIYEAVMELPKVKEWYQKHPLKVVS